MSAMDNTTRHALAQADAICSLAASRLHDTADLAREWLQTVCGLPYDAAPDNEADDIVGLQTDEFYCVSCKGLLVAEDDDRARDGGEQKCQACREFDAEADKADAINDDKALGL